MLTITFYLIICADGLVDAHAASLLGLRRAGVAQALTAKERTGQRHYHTHSHTGRALIKKSPNLAQTLVSYQELDHPGYAFLRRQ